MRKLTVGSHPDLKVVNPNPAAIDIGSTMLMAAVNPGTSTMPVRAFGTFPQDSQIPPLVPVVRYHQRGDGVDRCLPYTGI